MHTRAGLDETAVLAPSAAVWRVLSSVYEQLDIPVTHSDARGAELGNPGFRAWQVEGRRMAAYVDCGTSLKGQLANLYDVTLSVMTRLTEGPIGATIVTTTVDAFGTPRAVSGNEVPCRSRAVLERRVVEVIAEKLAGTRGPLRN
jgi:hypothetical protein